MSSMEIPAIRVDAVNDQPVREDGTYILYWMIAARRTRFNFALQHAVARGQELGKPVLVFEALRVGYRWASDRLHRFVIDGMAVNADHCAAADVRYYPYVEPAPGDGSGLLEALAERACLVVTDEFPCFFLPRMVASAGARLSIRLEQVDGNGLLPLRACDRAYPTAYAFRRHLQKTLPDHLDALPVADPLKAAAKLGQAVVAREVLDRWPPASKPLLTGEDESLLADLPIDHDVAPVRRSGGSEAGERVAADFLDRKLARYGEDRNKPEEDAASGLSPYLHFGHVSVHDVARRLFDDEGWDRSNLAEKASGSREGWWGASEAAESFLDELVTWREVGYGFCFHRPHDYDRYESLPDWAQQSLDKHAGDQREAVYTLAEFERGATHDELWNAAQAELRREGRIHNYLRMLWGKKILEWSESPRDALEIMIELNNKYALDGRNPNSYSGIFWTLGRFDRPWAPERKVFGVIRFMSSANTARKVRVKRYIQQKLRPGLFDG